MSRSRAYVFTVNNWTSEHEAAIALLGAEYTVYGKEVGASGTPHLQGYVYFKHAKTLKALTKKLPGAHWEVRRGTHQQAMEYCKKDGDVVEYGVPPKTQEEKGVLGKRVYEEAFELAKQGRLEEVDPVLRLKYYNTLKNIRKDYQIVPPAVEHLENEWYWGNSGTGKTRKAREENPDAYLKNANKWWDGYVDQEVVIIDEWSPSHECLASHLKQWADHHPFAAENKGGAMCIRPKKIIVTSNYSLEQCFLKPEDLDPMRRRFKVTHFTNLQ